MTSPLATGVLTKPDRIGRGDHDVWIRFITNEHKPLANGWFSVKQPDSQDVAEGITWEEARSQEELFFVQIQPWASLDAGVRDQLGTRNLTERLSQILSELIAKRYVATSSVHAFANPQSACRNFKMNFKNSFRAPRSPSTSFLNHPPPTQSTRFSISSLTSFKT